MRSTCVLRRTASVKVDDKWRQPRPCDAVFCGPSLKTSLDVAAEACIQVRPCPAEEERDGFANSLALQRFCSAWMLMSALSLQIISYKVTIVVTAFVATAAASVAYMLSDDVKQKEGQSIGMLDQMESSAEPRKVAHPSESNSRSVTPSKSTDLKAAPPSNAFRLIPPATESNNRSTLMPAAAKRQYRLITVLKGPPREAIIESGGSECLYRLGDRVPGWGVLIAITDRSVSSLKDELFIMNTSSGPSSPLRYSSSFTEPCMPATEVDSNASTPINPPDGRTRG